MGGKSSAITIGYRHYMTLFMCEARRCDYLAGVRIGDETAFEGEFTGTELAINKPQLFGGDEKEGGVVGTLRVRRGEATQMPDALLQSLVPGPWPAQRGLTTTVFDGQVGAMSPYIKLWKKRWGAFTEGWTTPVWQPDLCRIGRGKNAMHILYQCFTDTVMGMGFDPTLIDEDDWLAAAQTLYDEEFGLCLPFRRSEGGMGSYIQNVCDHIGGAWSLDMRTGKIRFRLFRPDYVVDALPVLDASNIKRMEKFDTPALEGSVNEMTIVGHDIIADKDISATFHNAASIQAQGRVVSDKRQFPGLWNRDLVERVAAREGLIVSSMLSRMTAVVNGEDFWNTRRGDVFALSWPKKKWLKVPVRVLDVDKGERTNREVRLMLVQDFSGMAAASYLSSGTTTWTAPDDAPKALPAQAAYEATYRDLVAGMSAADLAQVAAESGYLVAVGARPTGVTYGYDLRTRVGSAAFDDVAAGDYSPTGLLGAAIGPGDTSVTLTAHSGLDDVQVGAEWICGTEHGRVTSIDAGTGAVGIARGCVDTVPAVEHALGDRMWFVDSFRSADPTEYLDSETVDAKLLCRARQGTLDESLAPTVSVVMDQRQFRPYPPADLQINGERYPVNVAGEVTVSWVHRDRLLQADQLIDTLQAGIGPEAGTTYRVRFYDGATLKRTATTSGTSYTYLTADETLDGGPFNPLRVVVDSERDGISSRQALEWTFGRTP